MLLFLLFVVLPIAEFSVFIEVGQHIGIPATILLTLGTVFLGSFLVRQQGTTALRRFMQGAERGEMPLAPIADNVGILTAGVLLATPGFVTDFMGLLLFIPPLRQAFVRALFLRLLHNARIHIHYSSQRQGSSHPQQKDDKIHRSDNVIDAEFETIEPKDKTNGKKDRNSPWKKE